MNDHLRVPLTAGQKGLVKRAAEAQGLDMAEWARPVLIDAAESVLGDAKKKRKS
jgi:hypothetical protein